VNFKTVRRYLRADGVGPRALPLLVQWAAGTGTPSPATP
jgi:hypothetical protein